MISLKEKSLVELKKMASSKKIVGRSKMNKDELIKALKKCLKMKGGAENTIIDKDQIITILHDPSKYPIRILFQNNTLYQERYIINNFLSYNSNNDNLHLDISLYVDGLPQISYNENNNLFGHGAINDPTTFGEYTLKKNNIISFTTSSDGNYLTISNRNSLILIEYNNNENWENNGGNWENNGGNWGNEGNNGGTLLVEQTKLVNNLGVVPNTSRGAGKKKKVIKK